MSIKQAPTNDLILEWSRVTESVDQIRDLLDEMLAVHANSPRDATSSPGSVLADRVATLAALLRSIFANEESNGFIADLYQTAPQLSDGISQLKEERIRLLGMLDEISRLLQSPFGPTTSWIDMEYRFQQFIGLLAQHERSEDLLIQRTALDDSGVVD